MVDIRSFCKNTSKPFSTKICRHTSPQCRRYGNRFAGFRLNIRRNPLQIICQHRQRRFLLPAYRIRSIMEFFGNIPTNQTRIVSKLLIHFIKKHLVSLQIQFIFGRIGRICFAIVARIQSQNDFHAITFRCFKHFIYNIALHLHPR